MTLKATATNIKTTYNKAFTHHLSKKKKLFFDIICLNIPIFDQVTTDRQTRVRSIAVVTNSPA